MISGLTDNHTEHFDHNGSHFSVSNGVAIKKEGLSEAFKTLLWNAIQVDKPVQVCLADIMLIKSKEAQITQYYKCNYSEPDGSPDILACGTLGEREMVRCENRGNCLCEGVLCKLPMGLTRRELQVLTEIGQGKLDKEICDSLHIAKDTLRSHKDSISKKTNTSRKAQLSIVAHKLNLV